MKVTKYEQACLVLDDAGERLVIDPGSFSTLPAMSGVRAVVLTHEHPDHADAELLATLLKHSPQAQLIGPAGVAAALPDLPVQTVVPGQTAQLGPFQIAFGGGTHAEIHHSIPRVDNLTVLVDDTVYHPGDSLDLPGRAVQVLAAPISGPWLKLGEVMDYLLGAQATRVLPIHEMHAATPGQTLAHTRLGEVAAQRGAELVVLSPGESLQI